MMASCWMADGFSNLEFISKEQIDAGKSLPVCTDTSEELGFEVHFIEARV